MLSCYPSITADEFSEACLSFERKCHDKLEGTTWLSVHWTGSELRIKQNRPSTHADLGRFGLDGLDTTAGSEKTEQIRDEAELDHDEFVRIAPPTEADGVEIDFSITLSATYAVPVLWFDAPSISSLDELYQTLAPPHLRESVRSVGLLGGISQAYHPNTDLPSYFIHPCNTHEALVAVNSGKALIPEEYLLVWLGIVGSAVGLHVPSGLAMNVGNGPG